jgi:hypothetical protein
VNDIGNKLITLPDNVEQVDDLQSQMKGYIKGAVSDAVTRLKIDIKKIDTAQTKSIVDRIYHTSYDIISSWGGDDL